MTQRLAAWFKGGVIAAASMALYSLALGFFLALTLLVIAMEEGGDNLSQLTVPVTESVILLSQGIGFTSGSFTLSVIPLLLTILLIALISSLSSRLSTSVHAYFSGLIVWLLLTWICVQGSTAQLLDSFWLIVLKAALVFSLGFALAAARRRHAIARLLDVLDRHGTAELSRTVRIAVTVAVWLLALYLAMGLITVIAWIALNHAAMGKLFALSHMQNGSRALTTICSLAWLPNLCIWAVSWLFGAGFSIGDLATFTLWVGQSHDLPAVPVFALFPEPVANPTLRMAFVAIPMVCALLTGLAALCTRRGFHVHVPRKDQPIDAKELAFEIIYPIGAFCLSSAVLSLGASVLFSLSNGQLGVNRLKNIGVGVAASTQSVGRSSAIGLFLSWLLVAVVLATAFALRSALSRVRSDQISPSPDDADDTVRQSAPRVVNSTLNHKEEHDDGNNEQTHTKGSGIRLS